MCQKKTEIIPNLYIASTWNELSTKKILQACKKSYTRKMTEWNYLWTAIWSAFSAIDVEKLMHHTRLTANWSQDVALPTCSISFLEKKNKEGMTLFVRASVGHGGTHLSSRKKELAGKMEGFSWLGGSSNSSVWRNGGNGDGVKLSKVRTPPPL